MENFVQTVEKYIPCSTAKAVQVHREDRRQVMGDAISILHDITTKTPIFTEHFKFLSRTLD